ncbi:hypothetical protein AAG570_012870 [Ranatra chinensis]|uniref:guanylate kinase n=1 Tax=Ranatra chinensis TaxID=642074 RepID=A0ABD0YF43_9HEMI
MNRYEYKILVVCGPSGSGKSSLINRLFNEYPQKFGFSVSHTSRAPRPGEVNGQHYHFTTKEKIEDGIKQGLFLETAMFSGNFYGTSIEAVQEVCKSGKVCVLDIEIEGVKQVKQKKLDLVLVFVKPPSMEELEKRLRGRGTESEESLQRRLTTAKREMEYGNDFHQFDSSIIIFFF